MRRVMEWFEQAVIVPLMGTHYQATPIDRTWRGGIIGQINDLSRIILSAASDAQAGSIT